MIHDGMQYDPIHGQGHEPLKVGNRPFLKGLVPFTMGAGKHWRRNNSADTAKPVPFFKWYGSQCKMYQF